MKKKRIGSGAPKLKDLRAKNVDKDKGKAVHGGRDPASGLPTGKRMHKPFVVTQE
jgi:hypothetical protein